MSLSKKKIYIVDDDVSVCRALKLLMESFGFAVKNFLSAEKFFKTVPQSAQGCLILDIYMPGLNGWQTQQKLMKTGSSLPVIIITADKNGGLKEQAMKAGAVGFLQKPFKDNELVDLVNLAFEEAGRKEVGVQVKKKLLLTVLILVSGAGTVWAQGPYTTEEKIYQSVNLLLGADYPNNAQADHLEFTYSLAALAGKSIYIQDVRNGTTSQIILDDPYMIAWDGQEYKDLVVFADRVVFVAEPVTYLLFGLGVTVFFVLRRKFVI